MILRNSVKYYLLMILVVIFITTELGFAQGDPSNIKDDYISVESQPVPIRSIQALIRYPEKARKEGLSGKVLISVLIDENGDVTKYNVENSSNDIFIQPAVDAVKQSKFIPARQDGKPIAVWYTLPIVFEVSGKISTEITVKNVEQASPPLTLITPIENLLEYPDFLKEKKIEGKVTVSMLVDSTGKVIDHHIDYSDHPHFIEPVEEVMSRVRFRWDPSVIDRSPRWITLPVIFHLRSSAK